MAIATNPFVFIGCVELRQALDRHALDERELMDRLEDVPAGSIFYHTHGYRVLPAAPPDDHGVRQRLRPVGGGGGA